MNHQSTNRLSNLVRPSREFPRTFVLDNLDFTDWKNIEPYFRDLLKRKITDTKALENWLLDESELSAVIFEEAAMRRIAASCNMGDKEIVKANLFFIREIHPKISPLNHALNHKFIECTYLTELDSDRYGVLIRSCRNRIELFNEDNIPLNTEINSLNQEYQKVMGNMTINFQGKDHTPPQMGMFLQDVDRNLREEAWLTMNKKVKENYHELNNIFDHLLQLRTQIAINAGYSDFIEYQFKNFERFDYSPRECIDFQNSIETEVLPIARDMVESKRKDLGIDSLRPWDTACDRFGREPLRPFNSIEQLTTGCLDIFGKIDAEFGENFKKMIDLGLLDIESRRGKRPGGFMSTLSDVRYPFIFMNATGMEQNISTLLHEGGHAFHQFAVRNEPLISYRHAPMEFNEVASTSMELMGSTYYDVFYNDDDIVRSRRSQLQNKLMLMKSVGVIDAFQHWIYSHPGHSAEDRADMWLQINKRFSSGIDWTGFEDTFKRSWITSGHLFRTPFYFIEYGIALLGSLQIWKNFREDEKAAVEAYKSALALGGSRPLPELFEQAGTRFDFSDSVIRPLMSEVTEEIDVLKEYENK